MPLKNSACEHDVYDIVYKPGFGGNISVKMNGHGDLKAGHNIMSVITDISKESGVSTLGFAVTQGCVMEVCTLAQYLHQFYFLSSYCLHFDNNV